MDVGRFSAKLADIAMENLRLGNEIVIGMVKIPMALISVEYSGSLATPHVVWFPEATPRIKLEGGLRLFIELKSKGLVLAEILEKRGEKNNDVKFHEHLCKYGVIRRIGTIRDRHGPGLNSILFQSVGK